MTDPNIKETDITYYEHPELPLQARIYRNHNKQKQSAIIDIHGGAWSSYDRTADVLYDRYLASSDITVIAIDFRQGPNYKHPSASEDIEQAIQYARVNADALGIQSERIGLIGSSSGGHLALLSGITAKQKLDYVIALWPVSDPAYRYEYAKRENMAHLVSGHQAYYMSIDDMKAASVQRILAAGEWSQLPPLLVVQPGEDRNVPIEMTMELLRQYQAAGGYFEYVFFPGERHGFGHNPSSATDCLNKLIVSFIQRQLK